MTEAEYNSADIVKRLRAWSGVNTGEFPFGIMNWGPVANKAFSDAADEIERLRGEIKSLKDDFESTPEAG